MVFRNASIFFWYLPVCALLAAIFYTPATGYAAHGLSLGGELRYPPDFKHFSYTSLDARQGGQLTLHDLGSFDKLNPFTLKGRAPLGLGSYVFETLTVQSLDEPFSEYGLIAKDITLAKDKKSVIYIIDERARFSDGTPVTAQDVLFSLQLLKSEAASPLYQIYFKDIKSADILSPVSIRFNFSRVNRELHMIAGQLPVLNKAFYEKYPFDEDGSQMIPPIASGPYIVERVSQGKSILYRKNPNYWGKNHPTRRGMYNFDLIQVKFFKDQTVSLEALKAGEFDVMFINTAKHWARDMTGKRFNSGELVKKSFAHRNCAGMQGFVFNTRKPLFAGRRVRQALGLAFDFEWTNKALFYGQYTRTNSFFANSELAAQGLPSPEELRLLEPWRKQLPEEVFTNALKPPETTSPGSLRMNLRKARGILREEGWQIKNGILENSKGQPFTFTIILATPAFERVMASYVKNLEKLGIQASYRTLDAALYTDRIKNFDFDMCVGVFPQAMSPGNEQRDFWGSAAAKLKGSRNIAGIADPVVDSLVDAVIYAETREELVTACHALDRVLWHGYYVVPNWYIASYRYAYISRLRYPDTLPLYYGYQQFLDTWWLEGEN